MGHQDKKSLGATLTDKGVEFRVWAPFAAQVSVFIYESFEGKETGMTKEDGGYWVTTVPDAKAGQAYNFHIQTADGRWLERNDPRARQLTDSDEGRSIIVDPHFDWGTSQRPRIPLEKQIVYELHIGTFHRPDAATEGTFASAIEKLDYLQNLGITMIELMPITSMSKSYGWGYAPNHIFSVENAYGGRRGLLEFVKACHERGIGIILDVVYNHFHDKTDLWQFDGWSENNRGGIYFYNDERGDSPWGGRPDYGRAEVREYLLDNVAMWLTDYQVDGLRLDSTIYMRNTAGKSNDPDHDIPEAWSLMQEITTLAHKIDPSITVYAEDDASNDFVTKPTSEGGAGFDAQWEVGFPHVIRDAIGLTTNPSQARLQGIDYELKHTFNGYAFQRVIYSDSHDTAANGSTRLNAASTPQNATSVYARQHELLANAVALTSPGIPMLLQGEEFMQAGTFNDWQMLEWEKTSKFAGMVLAHQHLINLRKNIYNNTAGLTGGSIDVFHEDIANNVIAYHRWKDGGVRDDVLVILNFSDQVYKGYKLYVPVPGTWHVRFNSSWKGYSPEFNETRLSNASTDEDSQLTIDLADYNVLILAQDPTEEA